MSANNQNQSSPETVKVNASVLDTISPVALGFNASDIQFGELLGRVMVISDFPSTVGPAWLARLGRIPGVYMSAHLIPADPTLLIRAINTTIADLSGKLAMGSSAFETQRSQQSLHNAQALMMKIDRENQQVMKFTLVLLLLAMDKEGLDRRTAQVRNIVASSMMRARQAVFVQEQGVIAAGPFGKLPAEIGQMSSQYLPAETVAASFPFDSADIQHTTGVVLGGNHTTGGIILWNRWALPNHNMTVMATSGAGKSYSVKLMLLRELLMGAQVIIIDPEREYRQICRELGGTWVNCAGGSGVINPLEVRPEPLGDYAGQDDDADEPGHVKASGALALHMQRLKVFFSLYIKQLTDLERAMLEDAILSVYATFGVTWATDPADVQSWPTISDVYSFIKQRADSDATWQRLTILLRPAAEGSDAALWNGDSSVSISGSDLVVLDVHDLMNSGSIQAQYWNVLGFAWDWVRRDRNQKKLLVVDEAWLLVSPETPQSLAFLRDVAKRIRKYSGGLCVISQNTADFLAPEVARYGEAILGNAATKLFLRQGEKDLEAIGKLLSLSQAEQDLLVRAQRGEGLMIAGNARAHIQIVSSPEEHALLTGEYRHE